MEYDSTRRRGHFYTNVQASNNARVLLGDLEILIINSAEIPDRSDFKGIYYGTSLRAVAKFVSRPRLSSKIMRQLHDQIRCRSSSAKVLVIYGLGVSGKSQLVHSYIQQYREDYIAVFWIDAKQRGSIERDFLHIYGLLFASGKNMREQNPNIDEVVLALKTWFQNRDGTYLFVFDGADSIDHEQVDSHIDLNFYLPYAPSVDIIITTRSAAAKDMTELQAVEVGEMEHSEAIELFHRCSNVPLTSKEAKDEAGLIVERLGHLALAITLAGAYISNTPRLRYDLRKYLPEYEERRRALLCRKPKPHVHQYGESISTTWETCFAAINIQSPGAIDLLSLLAFVNPDDIYLDLFSTIDDQIHQSKVPEERPVWKSGIFGTTLVEAHLVEHALEALGSYSLIQWKEDQNSYSMHRLVHAWSFDRLNPEQQRKYGLAALQLVVGLAQSCKLKPQMCLRVTAHIAAVLTVSKERIKNMGDETNDVLVLLSDLALILEVTGQWPAGKDTELLRLVTSLRECLINHK